MPSEPTLYQQPGFLAWVPQSAVVADYPEGGEVLVDGNVVPVVRCEHGNIDGHWITAALWCPGAGIGGDDEN